MTVFLRSFLRHDRCNVQVTIATGVGKTDVFHYSSGPYPAWVPATLRTKDQTCLICCMTLKIKVASRWWLPCRVGPCSFIHERFYGNAIFNSRQAYDRVGFTELLLEDDTRRSFAAWSPSSFNLLTHGYPLCDISAYVIQTTHVDVGDWDCSNIRK